MLNGKQNEVVKIIYFKSIHRDWMPIRWMSKEAIQYGRYSEASDVWAFGVTLWEIYSYGKQPYEGYSNQEVIELISMRSLLECPLNCPTNIYRFISFYSSVFDSYQSLAIIFKKEVT